MSFLSSTEIGFAMLSKFRFAERELANYVIFFCVGRDCRMFPIYGIADDGLAIREVLGTRCSS